MGGVRYNGTDVNLQIDVGAVGNEPFTSNGVEAFGALSSRVASLVDLDPQASGTVRLDDIDGANGLGFREGSIRVSVDGTLVDVDLTNADTLSDVATRINDAIDSVDPAAGSVTVTPNGYTLTANAGHTVTVSDIGAGTAASDLGLDITATSAAVVGDDIAVRLTDQTLLADLGTAVDFVSGLSITQGEQTAVADFSTATTVQDLRNTIDALGFGLRLSINDEADGLNLMSEVSGISLSVGENGGTTAEDMGLRTMGKDTLLSDFRNGLGVGIIEGEDDFAISLHDGTSFGVDLSGSTSVSDVINAINTQASSAGLTVGVDFSAGLALSGNGITLTDNTVGADDLAVSFVGESRAAEHLGILQNAGSSNSLAGQDNSTVRAENVFTHMQALRDSLIDDDTVGITVAGGQLETDIDDVVQARAVVGVQAKRLEDQRTRNEDQKISEQTMLSTLQDADLTEVITRFQQLQQQLQASLTAGTQARSLSLLDFLS